MDENQYRERSSSLKDQLRDAEEAIAEFTDKDVFNDDDDIVTPLEEIKQKFFAFKTAVRSFIREFGRDAHPDWDQEWEAHISSLQEKYKTNE